MKRSNRLVLLIGVFLAIVAFVGVIVLSGSGGSNGPNATPPVEGPVVVATADIPLSTKIRDDQITAETLPLTADPAGRLHGQVAGPRQGRPLGRDQGQQITGATFGETSGGSIVNIDTPVGLRSIAVQVDQVTGVGTVIKTGDYVDMVVGLRLRQVPGRDPEPRGRLVPGGRGPQRHQRQAAPPGHAGPWHPAAGTHDRGRPRTPARSRARPSTTSVRSSSWPSRRSRSEVIKFAQLDGSISLVLRSPDDFIDPETGDVIPVVVPSTTTGVILKTLVESYGVLPPELVETVTP